MRRLLLLSPLLFVLEASGQADCLRISPQDKETKALIANVAQANSGWVRTQKTLHRPFVEIRGDPEMVDLAKWCLCVRQKKVEKYGPEVAEILSLKTDSPKYHDWMEKHSDESLIEHHSGIQTIEAQCFNESQSMAPATSFAAKPVDYRSLLHSTIVSGKGVGPLEVRMPKQRVVEILGPPRKMQRQGETLIQSFGPSGMEILISSTEGFVNSISLGETFAGSTDFGVKMRDSVSAVKTKMAKFKLVKESNQELLYENGMSFVFADPGSKGLTKISLIDPNSKEFSKFKEQSP